MSVIATQTITLPTPPVVIPQRPSPPPVYHLTLRRPLEPVVALVKSMHASDLFTPSLREKINEISAEYERCNERDPEGALLAIALFVTQVIHPAIENEGDQIRQNQLLDFEEEVKRILSTRLPEGDDVDEFLEACQDWDEEESRTQEKLQIIQSQFQAMHRVVDAAALASRESVSRMRLESAVGFLDIDSRRSQHSAAMHAQLNPLSGRVTAAATKIQGDIEKMDQLKAALLKQQKSLRKLLVDADEILPG